MPNLFKCTGRRKNWNRLTYTPDVIKRKMLSEICKASSNISRNNRNRLVRKMREFRSQERYDLRPTVNDDEPCYNEQETMQGLLLVPNPISWGYICTERNLSHDARNWVTASSGIKNLRIEMIAVYFTFLIKVFESSYTVNLSEREPGITLTFICHVPLWTRLKFARMLDYVYLDCVPKRLDARTMLYATQQSAE